MRAGTRRFCCASKTSIGLDEAIKEPAHLKADAKGARIAFANLGFSAAEAKNLRLQAAMMCALFTFIQKSELTQAQSAKVLCVTELRASDLIRGKIHHFR